MMFLLSQSRLGLALLFSIVLTYSGLVQAAASFSVSPVRVNLSAKNKVTSLTVTNQGKEPTTVQLDALAWSQNEQGQDVFEPSKNILANPPVFTIAPNSSQVIRLGLRKPALGQSEESYRLFLQEVPPPPKEGFTGLSIALRLSIPVFVQPNEPIKTSLEWRLKSTNEGLKLLADNQSQGHIQVLSVLLIPEQQESFANQSLTNYLLPQQKREWLIKDKHLAVGTPVMLKAQTDRGELKAQLTVEE